MKEITVHVKNLEQWRSVLDIWFGKGYGWVDGDKGYFEYGLKVGNALTFDSNGEILIGRGNNSIEYSEFMTQQKEEHMETYYVTEEQLDLIEDLKSKMFPMSNLIDNQDNRYDLLMSGINPTTELAIMRYIGGDETIEFKVKEQLYRLSRVDSNGDIVYMKFSHSGTPFGTVYKYNAFTASLEEIKKWVNPAYTIEEVD